MSGALALGVLLSLVQAGAGTRLERAAASVPSPTLIGGGVALLELRVVQGRVADTRRLQGAEVLLERLEDDVVGWRFEADSAPALLLAAGVYRPPQLLLEAPLDAGPVRGEASASLAFPVRTPAPAYPPDAVGDGVVLVEVLVDEAGGVAEARSLGPSSGFTAPALEAARAWRFHPAHREGQAVATRACLVFVFRRPVIPAPEP